MYKNIASDIKKYTLDATLYKLHKTGESKSDFGLDNSSELIDNGFGLYSAANMIPRIGPIKTEYFRISLIRTGNVTIDIGLETFNPVRNSIVFGFPGQIFSLYNKSDDFFCYYMLFTEEFVAESLLLKNSRQRFPFLTYSGVQSFQLKEEEADKIEQFILKMNDEIKSKKTDMSKAIQLYIQLILIEANRSYGYQILANQLATESSDNLFNGSGNK